MIHYVVKFQDGDGKMLGFERINKKQYKTVEGIRRAVERYRQKAIDAKSTIYNDVTKATQCTIYLTEYETTPDKVFCQFAF